MASISIDNIERQYVLQTFFALFYMRGYGFSYAKEREVRSCLEVGKFLLLKEGGERGGQKVPFYAFPLHYYMNAPLDG